VNEEAVAHWGGGVAPNKKKKREKKGKGNFDEEK